MSQVSFDPYHKWLGIATGDRPPTYYQLLGIARLESDVDVIEYNTDRQMLALRNFKNGPRGEVAKRIIAEVSAASKCLLNSSRKRKYDQELPSIARLPRPVVTASAPPPLPPSVHGHSPALQLPVHEYAPVPPPVPPPVHAYSPKGPGRSDPADTIAPALITRSVVGQRLRRYRPARTRDRIISRGRKS